MLPRKGGALMLLLAITRTDVLGTTRAATRFYGDGSFDCPHCSYPIRADQGFKPCDNPWCVANPLMPVDSARKILADAAAKAQEKADRERNHKAAMRRINEDQERRAAAFKELKDLAAKCNYCVTCIVKSDGRRKVRHRNRQDCGR